MTLYLLDTLGVFAEELGSLPADVTVIPAARQVALDGRPLEVAHGRIQMPMLPEGKHLLVVDGRTVAFRVQSGKLCAEFDPMLLLPTVARLCYLEKRVKAIEKKLADSEVDWLK